MKFAFLDEAGTGSLEREPIIVVAGVIVDADSKLRAVEEYLRRLLDRYVLPEYREGFVLHCMKLVDRRYAARYLAPGCQLELLHELCSVPKRFGLPLVVNDQRKATFLECFPNLTQSERDLEAIVIASINCAFGVDDYVTFSGTEHEVAQLVFENNDRARTRIKRLHNGFRKGIRLHDGTGAVPLQRMSGSPLFEEKSDSSLLQIADALAYFSKRSASGKSDAEPFVEHFRGLRIKPTKFYGVGKVVEV